MQLKDTTHDLMRAQEIKHALGAICGEPSRAAGTLQHFKNRSICPSGGREPIALTVRRQPFLRERRWRKERGLVKERI